MINLIKLCVGVSSVEDLEAWRDANRHMGLGRPDGNDMHRTRMMPKRADEIVGKGSLYWVMSGAIRGRQKIIGLEPGQDDDGRSHCKIILSPGVIRTVPQPKRPFQGWRYLKPDDAPADLGGQEVTEDDGELVDELARLGLI